MICSLNLFSVPKCLQSSDASGRTCGRAPTRESYFTIRRSLHSKVVPHMQTHMRIWHKTSSQMRRHISPICYFNTFPSHDKDKNIHYLPNMMDAMIHPPPNVGIFSLPQLQTTPWVESHQPCAYEPDCILRLMSRAAHKIRQRCF